VPLLTLSQPKKKTILIDFAKEKRDRKISRCFLGKKRIDLSFVVELFAVIYASFLSQSVGQDSHSSSATDPSQGIWTPGSLSGSSAPILPSNPTTAFQPQYWCWQEGHTLLVMVLKVTAESTIVFNFNNIGLGCENEPSILLQYSGTMRGGGCFVFCCFSSCCLFLLVLRCRERTRCLRVL
jgi:hypothetical protein